jgi:hypothetical protein
VQAARLHHEEDRYTAPKPALNVSA